MADRGTQSSTLPARNAPADLVATATLTVLALGAMFLPIVAESPIRFVLAIPFVLFLPGYAITAVLFPGAGDSPTATNEIEDGATKTRPTSDLGFPGVGTDGIDGIERAALSLALSLAVVPLLGLGLHYTPWGVQFVPVVFTIALTTLAATVGAAVKRRRLPEEERFRVPYRAWGGVIRTELLRPDSRTDAVLNVVIVLAVFFAFTSIVLGAAISHPGEQFTEAYLLTEDEEGDLVAEDYPEEFVAGEAESLVLGIENNEHEPIEYTIVVQIQHVELVDDEPVIREYEELDRYEQSLEHGETEHLYHELEPTAPGENLRVEYQLYRDDPPEEATSEDAYRTVHFWTDVIPDEETGLD